jgi:hypothetical protein
MAAAVDATAGLVVGAAALTVSLSFTVGASATSLLAWFESNNNSFPSLALVWDSGGTNQAMTLIGNVSITAGTGNVWLYGLVNPTPGLKTLTATWATTSNTSLLDAISFTGTVNSSVAAAFANFASATPTGTTGTLTVNGAAGNIQIAGAAQPSFVFTGLTATGSTQVFIDSTHVAGIGARAPSASSLVWTASVGTSTQIAMAGCDVVAAAAAAPSQTQAFLAT